jgi:hypothetical protein
MSDFYKQYPHFDWGFYINVYDDLRKAGINTEEKAIQHFTDYGCKEKRRTYPIIKSTTSVPKLPIQHVIGHIKQCYVSDGLNSFRRRFMNYFQFNDIISKEEPCVFFGGYTDSDLQSLLKHTGLKYIIWGGEDANYHNGHARATINEIKLLHNVVHLAISKCIYTRLLNQGISPIFVEFNMVDKTLFRPIHRNELGKCIYIFNGQTPGREHIYGKSVYETVMQRLPQYKYLFSNKTSVEHDLMPDVYKQCFIMLRLTTHDGNANSVQECEAMGIPVIHNQSDYGLKWKGVDDVIACIEKCAT